MIIAIGSDLCNIERIQNSLDRFGERLEQRVFTDIERAQAASRPFTKAGTLAKRFAAKEAFAKALGTGVRAPATLPAIGVAHDELGKPVFALTEALGALLAEKGLVAHLSISDEAEYAVAYVILERT